MDIEALVSTVAAAASLAAFVPSVASAQAYGGYKGYGYSDRSYYLPRYDDGRRNAWAARQRWEQRREWRERAHWERDEARRYGDRGYTLPGACSDKGHHQSIMRPSRALRPAARSATLIAWRRSSARSI